MGGKGLRRGKRDFQEAVTALILSFPLCPSRYWISNHGCQSFLLVKTIACVDHPRDRFSNMPINAWDRSLYCLSGDCDCIRCSLGRRGNFDIFLLPWDNTSGFRKIQSPVLS